MQLKLFADKQRSLDEVLEVLRAFDDNLPDYAAGSRKSKKPLGISMREISK